MQIIISGLQESMCSNTFNAEAVTKQSQKQLGKFVDDNSELQVAFRKTTKDGMYNVSLKLNTHKKVYSASASASIASKSFSDALDKTVAQLSKERSVQKSKRGPIDKGEIVEKVLNRN